MGFFDDLSKKATETYKNTAEKTTKLTKEMKLKSLINDDKGKIEKIYTEIGKKVYENHIREEKFDIESQLEESCSKIDAYCKEIEDMQKELLSLKGIRICKACASEISITCKFCPKCGTLQEDKKEEPSDSSHNLDNDKASDSNQNLDNDNASDSSPVLDNNYTSDSNSTLYKDVDVSIGETEHTDVEKDIDKSSETGKNVIEENGIKFPITDMVAKEKQHLMGIPARDIVIKEEQQVSEIPVKDMEKKEVNIESRDDNQTNSGN